MSDLAAEFRPIRVGSPTRMPVVIVPLSLIAVIGLAVFGSGGQSGEAAPGAAAAATIPTSTVVSIPWRAPRRTWSVSNPAELAPSLRRLMRLARVVDPYER